MPEKLKDDLPNKAQTCRRESLPRAEQLLLPAGSRYTNQLSWRPLIFVERPIMQCRQFAYRYAHSNQLVQTPGAPKFKDHTEINLADDQRTAKQSGHHEARIRC